MITASSKRHRAFRFLSMKRRWSGPPASLARRAEARAFRADKIANGARDLLVLRSFELSRGGSEPLRVSGVSGDGAQMANVFALHHEHHHLGEVSGVIRDALEVLGDAEHAHGVVADLRFAG